MDIRKVAGEQVYVASEMTPEQSEEFLRLWVAGPDDGPGYAFLGTSQDEPKENDFWESKMPFDVRVCDGKLQWKSFYAGPVPIHPKSLAEMRDNPDYTQWNEIPSGYHATIYRRGR